jgi:hypothetical protein
MKWTPCILDNRSKQGSVDGLRAIMKRRSQTRNWRTAEFDVARPASAKPLQVANHSKYTTDEESHGLNTDQTRKTFSLENPCLIRVQSVAPFDTIRVSHVEW